MSAAHGIQARLSETLRLTLIYRLARELNAELRSADVARRVLHAAAEALGTPYASIVGLWRGEMHDAYALGGAPGVDPRPVLALVLRDGLAGFALHNARTVVVNDIATNPLWLPLPDESFSPQIGSALCVPLIHAREVVGVLTLAHPARGYFTVDAVNLTATISEMGAAALTNTLLLEAAREAEQRYAALFDDAIVPIIITDAQGAIQVSNRRACEFLGYSREELERRTIAAIHRESASALIGAHFDPLQRGQEVRFRSTAWRKDGTSCAVEVYAKRLDHGPAADRIQWIEHDLSSQLMVEELRRDMTAMVYHDLRGPLGNVYSSLEALDRLLADEPNPAVRSLLDVACRASQQSRRMVDSLLDIQRLEEGMRLRDRHNSALNTLVEGAVEQMRPLAEEKNIRMRLALAADLPLIYVEPDMIERVVGNLIDNAIKYTPDGGVIVISTASSGGEVFIRVKDTGPGIPLDAQRSIFDKFARVRYRDAPRGVGLGLAFCKLAIEAHGGRIWVHSAADTGSIFTCALPVEAPATSELPYLGTNAT
ncbi:MAG: GAF domain-containing protein [Anaerolineae bacterium]|nr:GAF domain-containing protein [Anaerolineae bacterium]